MRIGVVVAQDFWLHFRDIYAALQEDHDTVTFRERKWPFQLMSERMNRILCRHDLGQFMRRNHVTFFEWAEYLFVTATQLRKCSRIVVRLHLHELWDFAPFANWEQVDRVIFVSRAMQRKFLDKFPEMDGRTMVVHNGVSLQKFRWKSRSFRGVIGTLGRIEPHKRVYDLIITLYELRKRGYDLVLDIGGDCTEARYRRYSYEVQSLVERLGLQPFVRFRGHVDNTPAWFEDVDIFVSNSCSEGLQVALLEAMASGCHCLSHWWDGAEEILPEDHLYWSDRELQEKIALFCDASVESREESCSTMRGIVEQRFDIDAKKLIVKRIIEDVAGNDRR